MSTNIQSIKQRFGIVGTSKFLEAALETAVRVAGTDLSVLITGESGVGKEVFSKVIHALSTRKHNQFIAINCGAIPEGTINSELFGHEKGSFTGAMNDRKGYFETVNGGTIFLDEIGEMPLDTQALLLRVLENGEFVRVGASKVEKTDVRVIAATNVQLEDAVRKGKFREDLYYRLNTVPIKVPSLKERPEDIYVLFRKFVSDFSDKYRMSPIQIDEKSRMVLERYTWPGNIRELKNVAEQLSVLSEERQIEADVLLDLMPHLLHRTLPSAIKNGKYSDNFEERELMYKFLYDMKNDLNSLKALIAELVKSNNLHMPNAMNFNNINLSSSGRDFPNMNYPTPNYTPSVSDDDFDDNNGFEDMTIQALPSQNPYNQPIILHKSKNTQEAETVDANLNLAEMEKDLILKALKKHNNRRKEASDDLGISERTLYRKIKEYNLD